MIRDCAGLESSDSSELVSAGPGDGGLGLDTGNEDILWRCVSVSPVLGPSMTGRGVDPPPRVCEYAGEFPDEFLEIPGRKDDSMGVPEPLASFLGNGKSFLIESAEATRWWPRASEPGIGDGAAEPLAAAAALRSSSLTCEACCSER
ncbi:hypothetical protein IMZ48_31420 [Candidatus Bathyarchaeota archaeon]|nr:hypothetical protein [Candidatus Bathyarchaeota archaeon]